MALPESPTYYQDESEVKFKGFDIQDMLLGAGSLFITLVFFFMIDTKGLGFFSKLLAWATIIFPFSSVAGWVYFLRYKKPKNYDMDFIADLFQGDGWESDFEEISHPLMFDDESEDENGT
jgi:hypothetical protein